MAAPPTPARPPVRNPRATLLLVGVAGVAIAYFLYSRQKAAAAAAAPAANTASTDTTNGQLTPPPAGTYDPNADTGALLGYLTGLQGAGSSPAAPAATSGTTTTAQLTQVPGNGDAANQTLEILGTIVSPSTYQGYNVSGGWPVYALVNGKWTLGLKASQLPVGTPLATSITNAPYVTTTSTKETLS